MKKFGFLLLFLLFSWCCIGCGGNAGEKSASNSVMTDAVTEQGSYKQFEELGIMMNVPQGATNISFFVVDKSIAEIDFTYDGTAYIYRGGKSSLGNISGVENVIDLDGSLSISGSAHNTRNDKVYDYDIFIRNTQKGGTLATWNSKVNTYTLYTPKDVNKEAMGQLCYDLAIPVLEQDQKDEKSPLKIIESKE